LQANIEKENQIKKLTVMHLQLLELTCINSI